MPKVSVCIPAYNQIKYLKKAIDSVLNQNFTDYEIIITDDSPSNIVADLVYEYDYTDKIKYFKNNPALGTPANWNKAIGMASGTYIKILHHDDWFTDQSSLKEYVKLLDENPSCDFAFSASLTIDVKNNRQWIHSATLNEREKLKKDPNVLFFRNFIGSPSAVIHKNNGSITYDINLKWVVDLDFYLFFLLKNKSFSFSERPLITVVSGDMHNVTNDCENEKNVEIFEYLHLFKKMVSKNKFLYFKKSYLQFLELLLIKYNIKSVKEIRESGFEKGLNIYLEILIQFKKFKPFLKKVIQSRQ